MTPYDVASNIRQALPVPVPMPPLTGEAETLELGVGVGPAAAAAREISARSASLRCMASTSKSMTPCVAVRRTPAARLVVAKMVVQLPMTPRTHARGEPVVREVSTLKTQTHEP